jgi:hypothetical protein
LLLSLLFSCGLEIANLSLHLVAVVSIGSFAQIVAVQLDGLGILPDGMRERCPARKQARLPWKVQSEGMLPRVWLADLCDRITRKRLLRGHPPIGGVLGQKANPIGVPSKKMFAPATHSVPASAPAHQPGRVLGGFLLYTPRSRPPGRYA